MGLQQQTAHYSKELKLRMRLSGGVVAGYLLFAATVMFAINIAYHAIQAQVFDDVVAAMVGVVFVHFMIAIMLVVAFDRPPAEE
jgi:dolichol kinase